MKVKHSKYKNTGVIFELLIRQITRDSLEGKESPVKKLLPKYFVNTELGKEYKLYESLSKNNSLSESKAETVLNILLETSKTLNRGVIKRQKYNLIKEIKEICDINKFFSQNIQNYKLYASFYNLLEYSNHPNLKNLDHIIQNKLTIIEYLTPGKVSKDSNKISIIEEFTKEDKEIRLLTYKILLEKFNEKYKELILPQKNILKKILLSSNNQVELKEFYLNEILSLRTSLVDLNSKTTDQVTKIKINEIADLLNIPQKTDKIKDNDLVNLMQYHELVKELKKVNE